MKLPFSENKTTLLLSAVIFLIALLAYSQFFGISIAEFDAVNNTLSHSAAEPAEILRIFTQPEQRYHVSSTMYRPVESLLWWLFFQLFSLNFAPYHMFNFALHAVNSALVFLVGKKLLGEKKGLFSFIAAILFALHPIQINTVVFTSRVPELLMAFSVLSSLLAIMRFRESGNKKFLLLALFLCAVGVFSKDPGPLIVVVLFLYTLVFSREKKFMLMLKSALRECLPFLAIGACYVSLMLFSLGRIAGTFAASEIPRASGIVFTLSYLLFPIDILGRWSLQDIYSALTEPMVNAAVLTGFFAFSITSTFLLSRRAKTKAELFLLYWLLLFFLGFVATNALAWWYLYVPAIPFVLLLSSLFRKCLSAISKRVNPVKKAFASALSACLILLFLYFALLSPLFVQYGQFGFAENATRTFLEAVSDAASPLPENALAMLVNCPEFMVVKEKGLPFTIPLENEASVQAFLEWKFPEKKLNIFSIEGLFLLSNPEEVSLSTAWAGNCVFLTRNHAREKASIYVPAPWRPQSHETDSILLTPNYREEESISITFPPEMPENTFIIAFDGKKAQAFALKEHCK